MTIVDVTAVNNVDATADPLMPPTPGVTFRTASAFCPP